MVPALPHEELTGKVIKCAMEVHSILGSGFQEVVYQRALGFEMERAGIDFGREVEMRIIYKDREVGLRRVDFFLADAVMLELKAVVKLEDVHLAQAINLLGSFQDRVWPAHQLRRRKPRVQATI